MKDAACRLAPLGAMVLALLREDDMHPYEMIRLLRQRRDDRIVPITNGTMYHTVARLEKQGLLAEVGVDRDGNRPERTTYTLTDAGDAALVDWVRRELATTDHPAEFRVALAEAHNLPREDVLELLRERLAGVAADRAAHGAALAGALAGGVFPQYLIEVDRQHALLEADHTWLAAFIERLTDPAFVWGSHAATDRYLAHREAARQ